MEVVVAFLAQDEGLPPAGDHHLYPVRSRFPSWPVEVFELSDMVDFHPILASAHLTFVGHKPLKQF
jgi:hypothetical protein